jgi:hypothetical protein
MYFLTHFLICQMYFLPHNLICQMYFFTPFFFFCQECFSSSITSRGIVSLAVIKSLVTLHVRQVFFATRQPVLLLSPIEIILHILKQTYFPHCLLWCYLGSGASMQVLQVPCCAVPGTGTMLCCVPFSLPALGGCQILTPEAPLVGGSAPWMYKGHTFIANTTCCLH